MIGSIISGAMGLGSSIFGGIKAARAMRQARNRINQQRDQNQAWFDREYNQDATRRADAQRVLSITEQAIRDRNKAAAGQQAVLGGTDESLAAARQAGSQAVANAAAGIAAQGASRKDRIAAQYQARDQQLQSQLNNLDVNKANTIAGTVKDAATTAASIGTALDQYTGKPAKTPADPDKKQPAGDKADIFSQYINQ